MENDTQEKKQRSRRSRKPSNGEPPARVVTSLHDINAIFLPLWRHGYLPTSFVCAFRDPATSARALKNRLSHFYEATYDKSAHYIVRLSTRSNFHISIYREEINAAGELAKSLLIDNGLIPDITNPLIPKTSLHYITNVVHTVMISTTSAAIELGARARGARFHSWYEIWEHLPIERKELEHPFSMKADISHRFGDTVQRKSYNLTPDGVFVLQNGDKTVAFCIEAENQKASKASNLDSPSFLRTFLGYRSITASKAHHPLFGKTSLMVIVVARSQRHLDTMKQTIMQATDGRGSSQFCFAAIPVIDTPDGTVQPKPETMPLYEMPLQRAGHPDFYLSTLSEKHVL